MAFDTAAKRQSMFSHAGRFWMGKAYDPSGSIDAIHRMQSLTVYAGTVAPPPIPPVAPDTDQGSGYMAMSYYDLVHPPSKW